MGIKSPPGIPYTLFMPYMSMKELLSYSALLIYKKEGTRKKSLHGGSKVRRKLSENL